MKRTLLYCNTPGRGGSCQALQPYGIRRPHPLGPADGSSDLAAAPRRGCYYLLLSLASYYPGEAEASMSLPPALEYRDSGPGLKGAHQRGSPKVRNEENTTAATGRPHWQGGGGLPPSTEDVRGGPKERALEGAAYCVWSGLRRRRGYVTVESLPQVEIAMQGGCGNQRGVFPPTSPQQIDSLVS